jgi:Ca2+-binding EF-hand superfamily protein
MKFLPTLLMLTVLAGSGTCLADGDALLKVLDRDGNGYLTLDETQNNPDVHFRFSQLDRNQNGRLDADEMKVLNVKPSFSDFDIDESLGISPEEASALRALQNDFNQLDRNQNQTIDPDEFAQFSVDSAGSG